MTKAELVEDVARAAELTKKDAERLVEIVFESIIETLNQGEKIELRGFGSFRVRERGARRGRNPKTGDPVSIPAKRVPYFKPGKELKELINDENSGSPRIGDKSFTPDQRRHPSSAHPLSCKQVEVPELERLWSPWRARYIASGVDAQRDGCVFCLIASNPEQDETNFVLHRGAALFCGPQSLSLHHRASDGRSLSAHE